MAKKPKPPASEDYVQLATDYVLPTHKLDERKNLVWNMILPVQVIRMDNTLAMSEHVGTLKDDKGKPIADIAKAMGGVVFIIHPKNYKGKGNGAFAIDCAETVKFVANLIPDLGKFTPAPMPVPSPDKVKKAADKKASRAKIQKASLKKRK